MKLLKITFLLFSLIWGFSSCEDDKEKEAKGILTFRTEMTTANGAQKVMIGDTIIIGDYDFNLKKFKLYLSNISLIRADGSSIIIEDILLADVGDAATGQFSVSIDPDEFTGVYLGYGLDSMQNNSIPESFERDHPLSSFNQMYWTMLKYRFAILEGRSNYIDSMGTASDKLNAYHPGTDIIYRTKTYPLNLKVTSESANTIILSLALDNLFMGNDTIDLLLEPQSHSEAVDFDIAIKFMDNLSDCAEISLL
ncbi:MAG: hypothetical protein ACJAUR_001042 [Ulvibacter sp.]|jgi:hypothetical protein